MSIPWEVLLGVLGVVWEVVLDEDLNVLDMNSRKHGLFGRYRTKHSMLELSKHIRTRTHNFPMIVFLYRCNQ